jgi:hypothetical protein
MQGFRGLVLPDERLNREMLRAGGSFDKTARDLQSVMVKAGLLRTATPLPDLAYPALLPI